MLPSTDGKRARGAVGQSAGRLLVGQRHTTDRVEVIHKPAAQSDELGGGHPQGTLVQAPIAGHPAAGERPRTMASAMGSGSRSITSPSASNPARARGQVGTPRTR